MEHRGWPYVFIIARQDIAAGTELTIDYGEGCAALRCLIMNRAVACRSIMTSDYFYRYWISAAHDQNELGMTVRAHEEAHRLMVASGCPHEPIVL